MKHWKIYVHLLKYEEESEYIEELLRILLIMQ